ncbi:hypothetical protein C8Q69DRAFT_520126 [Paecilomyces variotii]|uniref:Uncharacterized protein n=1 Tax=Byssochlamys spectabilis TaxID=264951 RepID=A0A443HUB2_BYSSP|nr:hypothetical protein C8Q69DRAFT_520126 [Paecilomyces variotii]RWQ95360.1 hypothetical protein C8Q69DRAFT_520126 [Paecilomyces variotii]
MPYTSAEGDSDGHRNTERPEECLVSRAHVLANLMGNASEDLCSLVTAMAAEIRQKDLELKAAEVQICKLENAVSDSTKRLLKTLPTSSLDDSRLRGEYSTLRGSVEDWVWLLPAATLTQEYQSNMAQLPAEHALRFSVRLFVNKNFMISLETSMGELNGDKEAINAWRSNTMRAHVIREAYNRELHAQIGTLNSEILSTLSFIDIDLSDPLGVMDDLRRRVLLPAAKLAEEMSYTPESYHWKWYDNSDEELRELKRLSKSSVTKFVIVDSQTHNEVKKEKLAVLPSNQRIGQCLLVIFPALFRQGNGNGTWIQIEKATILVKLSETVSAHLNRQSQLQRVKKESEDDHMDGLESPSKKESLLVKTEYDDLQPYSQAQ